jgi:hypothetical protein
MNDEKFSGILKETIEHLKIIQEDVRPYELNNFHAFFGETRTRIQLEYLMDDLKKHLDSLDKQKMCCQITHQIVQ